MMSVPAMPAVQALLAVQARLGVIALAATRRGQGVVLALEADAAVG